MTAADQNPTVKVDVFATEGNNEIIVRHGQALPLHEVKPVTYSGRLDTPRAFLSKKRDAKNADDSPYYQPQDATFVVDEEANRVTLYLNEWDTPTDVIAGELKPHPALALFNVNGKQRWGINQLWEFLKPLGYYFADKEAHRVFLQNLRQFNSKVSTAVSASHDNAGNKKATYERVVEENSLSNDPTFVLSMPLFQGYEAKTFRVELGFEPTDGGVSIFLTSDELFVLLLEERDALMEVEKQYFEEWGCSVLVKS